ncbi:MAG: hypothetical protein AAF663_00015 [Planctomycetota bacterium]
MSIINTATSTALAGDPLRVPPEYRFGVSSAALGVRTSFQTNSHRSVPGRDRATIAYGRPDLTLLLDEGDAAAGRGRLSRLARELAASRSLLPLLPDMLGVTAQTAAGATVVPVNPTTNKRWHPGMRVLLAQRSRNDVTGESAVVSAVAESQITLTAATTLDLTCGHRLVPLLEVHPPELSSGLAVQDGLTYSGECRVSRNAAAPPTLVGLGQNPSGVPVLDGWPVFLASTVASPTDLGVSWSYAGRSTGLGNDRTFESARPYTRESLQLDMMCGRAEWYRMLRFYHSRGGGTYPFWFASPMHPIGQTNGVSRFNASVLQANEQVWPYMQGAMLQYADGSTVYARIQSIAGSLITFTSEVLTSPSNPCQVFELLPCRFTSPFEEQWLYLDGETGENDVCQVSVLAEEQESGDVSDPVTVTIVDTSESCTPAPDPCTNPAQVGTSSEGFAVFSDTSRITGLVIAGTGNFAPGAQDIQDGVTAPHNWTQTGNSSAPTVGSNRITWTIPMTSDDPDDGYTTTTGRLVVEYISSGGGYFQWRLEIDWLFLTFPATDTIGGSELWLDDGCDVYAGGSQYSHTRTIGSSADEQQLQFTVTGNGCTCTAAP